MKFLFDKFTRLLDPEIKKMLVRVSMGKRILHSILVQDLLAIKTEILFLLTIKDYAKDSGEELSSCWGCFQFPLL